MASSAAATAATASTNPAAAAAKDDEYGGEESSAQPTIVNMPADSVRRIVAGQAISDLASAVKELVDNALDAGAKSINIRLFEKGLGIVEVSDDGCGVPRQSRSSIATPHATSKITTFDDIYATHHAPPAPAGNGSGGSKLSSNSLGFRGEALYSLANLSEKLVVATRTEADKCAQKMEFGRDGSLVVGSVSEMPRKVGTTVAVLGLLKAVPVRRRDFEQRIQQHRSKLVQLMTAYALFSTGVRLNLMDMQQQSGREKTVLCTAFNSATLHDTVASVLGTKVLTSMTSIAVDLSHVFRGDAMNPEGDDTNITPAAAAAKSACTTTNATTPSSCAASWKVTGLISTAGIPRDKTAKGQYFAINRRPVELPKVARLLNECFRAFAGSGGDARPPVCVLEFTLPGAAYDINLSPDKRQVLLTSETEICTAIRSAVVELWSSQTGGQFQHNDSLAPGMESSSAAATTSELLEEADEEIGDVSGSSRLFHRRYAFVNDPTTAAAKEQHDGLRRLEYETASPGGTVVLKRRKSGDQYDCDSKRNGGNETSVGGDSQEPIVRQESASTSSSDDESVNDLAEFGGRRKRLRVEVDHASHRPGGNNLSTVTPSPSNAPPDAQLKFRAAATATLSEKENRRIRERRAGVSGKSPTQRVDPISESSPATPSERQQWQEVQAKFNHSRPTEEDESVLAAAGTSSARSSDDHIREKPSLGLERFGFRVVETRSGGKSGTNTAAERRSAKTRRAVTLDPSSNSTSVRDSTSRLVRKEGAHSESTASRPTAPTPSSMRTATAATVWNSFQDTHTVTLASMRDRIAMRDRKRAHQSSVSRAVSDGSGPSSIESNDAAAEPSTSISLSKDDFKSMIVIGQFNLGFILVRSQDGNLWILDQHACDEKYTFEKLCVETRIHEQRLISPMPLELSPSEETCVLDHMEIFEKNGFRFSYDESKPPRHRLALTALPHSGARDGRKAVTYGKDDVSALCAILSTDDDNDGLAGAESGGTGTDGNGLYGNNAVRRYATGNRNGETADRIIARLPKTIAMFASRACRGSIMIGKGLSENEMARIVKRLSEIDQPWNCPHGRPTMRHVGDLQPLLLADEKKAKQHIAGPTITVMSQDMEE